MARVSPYGTSSEDWDASIALTCVRVGDSVDSLGVTDLASRFQEHEILLTGANGFLGKVILAMLLDRFPQVQRIHVLVRPRSALSSEERFATEVLDSPPLRPLIERCGREAVARRVNVLSGDASEPSAGLDSRQVGELAATVGLVLNCAGLVEFLPPVDQSIRANIDSVEQILGLCRLLDAKLLHISTCYVAGEADGLIEETEPIPGFFPQRVGSEDQRFCAATELAECREAVTQVAQGLTGTRRAEALTELGHARAARWGWVNTYTYTKSLGEQILAAQREVPYAIVRPAIVESALRYPFPGWIEGGRTAAPLALMALGGLLDWPARPDIALEIVPVDLVAAATLAVAGDLIADRSREVYQLATADVNPYPLEDLIRLLCRQARMNGGRPARPPVWLDPFPRLRFLDGTRAARRRRARRDRVELVRGFLERTGFSTQAARLRVLELQMGFHEDTFRQYLPFILENRYVFETGNIRATYAGLSTADRSALPWDPETIDWPSYWRDCQIRGIREWVQPEAVREWTFKL